MSKAMENELNLNEMGDVSGGVVRSARMQFWQHKPEGQYWKCKCGNLNAPDAEKCGRCQMLKKQL